MVLLSAVITKQSLLFLDIYKSQNYYFYTVHKNRWMLSCLVLFKCVKMPRLLSYEEKSELNESLFFVFVFFVMFVCVQYVFLSLCFICLVLSFHPSFLFLSHRIKHVYQLSLHLASSSQHATQLIESFNNRYSSGSVCACNCDCVMCVFVGG